MAPRCQKLSSLSYVLLQCFGTCKMSKARKCGVLWRGSGGKEDRDEIRGMKGNGTEGWEGRGGERRMEEKGKRRGKGKDKGKDCPQDGWLDPPMTTTLHKPQWWILDVVIEQLVMCWMKQWTNFRRQTKTMMQLQSKFCRQSNNNKAKNSSVAF